MRVRAERPLFFRFFTFFKPCVINLNMCAFFKLGPYVLLSFNCTHKCIFVLKLGHTGHFLNLEMCVTFFFVDFDSGLRIALSESNLIAQCTCIA